MSRENPTPAATGSSGRSRLTVALLVHEEPQLLPASLDSVRGLADELLIIETGSAQRTWQFASRYGARVVPWAWNDDWSAVRNFAVGEASGDWMLWLEAGEVVEPASAAALREFLGHGPPRTQALLVYVELPSATGQSRAEQQAQLRLVPRVPGLEYVGRICETARPSLTAAGVTVDVVPWRIIKSAAEHDVERRRRRARRDLRLLNLELHEHGPRAGLLLAQGEIESAIGQAADAAKRFRQAISLAPRGSREMLEGYYGLLTTFDETSADGQQKQLAACLEALEIYPFDAQLLAAAGGYLQKLGQPDLARRSFETAVRYGQVNPETWHLVGMSEFTTSLLALHLLQTGQESLAAEVVAEALTRASDSVYLRGLYLDLLVKLGRTTDALVQIDRLPADTPGREALRSAIRGGCQAAKQNWIPAIAYLETAYSAGCRHPLCLRWYTVALLSTGHVETARPVLAEWLSLAPHDAEAAQYAQALETLLPEVAARSAAVEPRDQVASPAATVAASASPLRQLRLDAAREPHSPQAHLRLGQAYREAGDPAAALAVWRDFATRNPRQPDVLRPLVELLVEAGQTVEAGQWAAQLPTTDAGLAAFLAGVTAAEARQWSEAIGHFEAAHRTGYRHTLLVPQWSICLVQAGRFDEAQGLLRQLATVQPPHFALAGNKVGQGPVAGSR